ncbi:MAG: ribonuclease D [Thiohalospira sp.]
MSDDTPPVQADLLDLPPLVDRADALTELTAHLAEQPWLAVDTEFLRERTYYPQLCLVQVATPEGDVACIDPLALTDLSPLWAVLADPGITKVFHAAAQDVEVLLQTAGAVPAPLFDTQIAAALSGLGDQVGYARLVEARLGVTLDKSASRADWSRRPLEPELLRYAGDDVRYLARLYPALRDELAARGRLAWLEDDFARLTDPAAYANPPLEAWRRVRGHHQLDGPGRGILRALAAWREEAAAAADIPRGWVVRDELLLEIARRRPRNAQRLGKLRGSHKLDEATREALLARVNATLDEPPAQWPAVEARPQLEPAGEAAVDALMAVARLAAEEAGVSVASLTGRKELERLVAGETDLPVLQGWRGELAGRRLRAWLAGEIALVGRDGGAALA